MAHYLPAIFIARRKTIFLCLLIIIPLYAIKAKFNKNGYPFDPTYSGFPVVDFLNLYFDGMIQFDFAVEVDLESGMNKTYVSDYSLLLQQILILESSDSVTNYIPRIKKELLIEEIRTDIGLLRMIDCGNDLSSYILDYAFADRRSHYYQVKLQYMIEDIKLHPDREAELFTFFKVVLNFITELYDSGLINSYRKNEQTSKYGLLEKILNYLSQNNAVADHKNLIKQIFDISRKGEMLNNRTILTQSNTRSSLLRNLLYQIEPLEKELYANEGVEKKLKVLGKRNALRVKYLKLIQSANKVNDNIDKADDQNHTTISFFHGNQHIYQYVYNRSGSGQLIKHLKPDLEKSVECIISEMDSALFKFDGDIQTLKEIDRISDFLYEQIFHPIHLKLMPKIVIVPDGNLCFFPFEVLRNDGKLLIEKHELVYDFKLNNRSELMIGNIHSVMGLFEGSLSIPKIRDEIFNESLSFTDFEKTATDKTILHIGTHQVFKDEEPVMLLSNTDSIYLRDWYHVPDILGVLMSMCAGLRGNLISGENADSFGVRAYETGVENVISSLWAVDDYSTGNLLMEYMKNLKLGMFSSASLRKAKLEYLRNNDAFHGHPVFWASFVHYGNDYAVENNNKKIMFILMTCLILVFLINLRIRIQY
ncbi:CHAT domain-containing protein [Ekhidna sp.]|uniref:CHAT domain-containing protein n=1 Tax=Ekhidna sp. TaxID=2608089 RepID=UPI00329A7A7A